MSSFQVKVCGLTRPADVKAAVRLGADMIGFIFYRRSSRHVNMKTAALLAREVSPVVDRVGVFVGDSYDRIMRVAERVGLQWVQLHRSDSKGLVSRLHRQGLRVTISFHIATREDYAAVYDSSADLVMLDNATANLPGGTGAAFDWSIRPAGHIPNLVLAGGINVDNVAEGVRRFKPLVVDVNSGVESSPGKKSKAKLKAFLRRCYEIRCGDRH